MQNTRSSWKTLGILLAGLTLIVVLAQILRPAENSTTLITPTTHQTAEPAASSQPADFPTLVRVTQESAPTPSAPPQSTFSDKGVIIFSLDSSRIDSLSPDVSVRVEALRVALAEVVGREVEIVISEHPVEALCSGEAHAAILDSLSYLAALERGCAQAVVIAIRGESQTHTGQIYAHVGVGIEGVEMLVGHTFCRPDPLSTAGWVVPSIIIQAAGLDPARDLAHIVDSGSDLETIRAIYQGDCDAGAASASAAQALAQELPDLNQKIVPIAETVPIPNDVIVIRPDAASLQSGLMANAHPTVMESLKALLGWDGAVPPHDQLFQEFYQLLKAAGNDIQALVES